MPMNPRAKRWLKRLGLAALVFLLLIVLLLVSVVWALNTQWGRGKLTTLINEKASSESMTIKLAGLESVMPWDLRLDSFSLADADGVWLAGEKLSVSVDLAALLHKAVTIDHITLDKVEYFRPPLSEEKEPEPPKPISLEIPAIPPIRLDTLRVGECILHMPPPETPDSSTPETETKEAASTASTVKAFTIDGTVRPEGQDFVVELGVRELAEHVLSGGSPPAGFRPDSVNLNVRLQQPGNILAVDATLREGSDGLVGAALGLSPQTPLSGGLQGKGGLEHWQGDLSVKVGEAHLLKAGLTLQLDQEKEEFRAGLAGRLQDPAELLPPDIVSLSGEHADFDIALTLPLDGDLGRQASLDTLKLASPTFSLDLAASVREEKLNATVALHVLEEKILPQLTGGALTGAPTLAATLTGGEEQLKLDLRAGLGSLALPELGSDPAKLRAIVTVDTPLDATKRAIAANGELVVDGLRPPEQYTLDPNLSLAFDLAMEEQTRVQVRSLKLLNGENTLDAKGDVDLAIQKVQAHLRANLPHAGALMTLHPLDAAITLEAEATGAMESGINATLSGGLREIKGLDPQLAALLGDALELEAKAFVDQNTVRLHGLDVTGRTSLSAAGEFGLQEQTLDASLSVTPPGTLTLPGEAGGPDALKLTGLKPLELTAKGSLKQRLEVTAAGGAAEAALPDRRFTDLVLALAAGVPLTPTPEEDHFSLDLKTAQIGLKASSRYRLEQDSLELRELKLNGPDTSISGALRVGLKDTLAQGEVDVKLGRLAAYAQLLGMDLAGTFAATIKLSTPNNRQAVNLAATGSGLAAAGAEVASLKLDVSTPDAFGIAQGNGSVDLRLATGKAGVEAAHAEALDLNVRMKNGVADIDLKTKGKADKDFDLALKASVTPTPERIEVRVDALSGNYAAIPLKISSPATIVSAQGGVTVKGLALAVDKSVLKVDGAYGPTDADLTVRLDNFALQTLERLEMQMPLGEVDLNIALKGALAAPGIQAQLQARNVEMPQEDPDDPDFPPLNLDLDATLQGGKLGAKADLSHDKGSLATLEAGLPMQLSLQPFAFKLEENAPLSGKVKGGFDLELVQNILAMTDQTLDGDISYDVNLSGQLKQLDVTGSVELSKGRYENLKLGTLLTDLSLRLTASGQRFEITKLSANDGQGGSISGKGGVTLEGDYPFEAEVRIDKLAPVNMDIFHGQVSGSVDVTGNAKQGADVVGKLTVNQAELALPKSLPPSVVSVDVEQVNDGSEPPEEQEEQEAEEEASQEAFPVKLDISVNMPGRFFVRGMGLDSEWKGNLNVTGTAATPRIVGLLTVSRGSFEFLEQIFQIDEGRIRFSGGSPPSPVLKIVTSTQARDVTAKVIISGTVQHLTITFDSEPSLPQNEILAAVLFGRSLDSLTPLQALRLARALDQLSGGSSGGSLDVLQNLKSVMHVDELSAGEGKSGDMTLQAGKYLSDGVYLKGTKGLDPRDDSVSVEVEITPNLGLESEMGSDSQGGVGLNWRYDY